MKENAHDLVPSFSISCGKLKSVMPQLLWKIIVCQIILVANSNSR